MYRGRKLRVPNSHSDFKNGISMTTIDFCTQVDGIHKQLCSTAANTATMIVNETSNQNLKMKRVNINKADLEQRRPKKRDHYFQQGLGYIFSQPETNCRRRKYTTSRSIRETLALYEIIRTDCTPEQAQDCNLEVGDTKGLTFFELFVRGRKSPKI